MKRPGIFQGIVIALVLAVLSSAIFMVTRPLLGGSLVLRGLISLMSLVYVLYLLRKSTVRTGRITTVAAWLVFSISIWLWSPPLTAFLLTYTGFIWLVRSFYFHSSILTSLTDLGLCCLAVIAAAWAATQTNSLFLSVWCFFLVQALFVLVPAGWARRSEKTGIALCSDRFTGAYRNAEAAWRRLSSIHNH